MPVTYNEYSFTTEPDPELRELIQEYDRIINDAHPIPDIMNTWTVEKPAGLIEILPPDEKRRENVETFSDSGEEDRSDSQKIYEFLYEFNQWFYYCFDGYFLFFSRFPTIPNILANAHKNGDTALTGVLLGYPLPDVAEYGLKYDNEFKTEKQRYV